MDAEHINLLYYYFIYKNLRLFFLTFCIALFYYSANKLSALQKSAYSVILVSCYRTWNDWKVSRRMIREKGGKLQPRKIHLYFGSTLTLAFNEKLCKPFELMFPWLIGLPFGDIWPVMTP